MKKLKERVAPQVTSEQAKSPDNTTPRREPFRKLARKGGGILNLCAVPKDLSGIQVHRTEQEVDSESVGVPREGVAEIWHAVEELYRTGTHPGISLCIRRRGQVILNRAIGHARGNGPHDALDTPKLPMLPETPVCYFSATKAVTAVLTHFLVEDKLIHLHDPVSYYTPEFGKRGKANITVHQVLAHRSGVPGIAGDTTPERLWDHDWIWDMICKQEPSNLHGHRLEYHALTGGYVLQRVLEKVTGGSIGEYLNRRIRKPMGMQYFDYGLAAEATPLVAENYATGMHPFFPISALIQRALGAPLEVVEGVINHPKFREVVVPAGNMFGTAEEMSRFYQMLLNQGEWNGKKICEPITVKRIVQEYASTQMDWTLFMPMRYSAGLMLGNEPFGLWGKNSRGAFGHIGLINKLGWADGSRDIAVCMMNTGIPFISAHYPALIRFMSSINKYIPQDGPQA